MLCSQGRGSRHSSLCTALGPLSRKLSFVPAQPCCSGGKPSLQHAREMRERSEGGRRRAATRQAARAGEAGAGAPSSVRGPQGREGLCTSTAACGLQTATHISALSPTPPSFRQPGRPHAGRSSPVPTSSQNKEQGNSSAWASCVTSAGGSLPTLCQALMAGTLTQQSRGFDCCSFPSWEETAEAQGCGITQPRSTRLQSCARGRGTGRARDVGTQSQAREV